MPACHCSNPFKARRLLERMLCKSYCMDWRRRPADDYVFDMETGDSKKHPAEKQRMIAGGEFFMNINVYVEPSLLKGELFDLIPEKNIFFRKGVNSEKWYDFPIR